MSFAHQFLLLLVAQRPLEKGKGERLGLTLPAPGLHRFLLLGIGPVEQGLLPFGGFVAVAITPTNTKKRLHRRPPRKAGGRRQCVRPPAKSIQAGHYVPMSGPQNSRSVSGCCWSASPSAVGVGAGACSRRVRCRAGGAGLSWACTYRIANFSLGGTDLRSPVW